MQTVRRSFAFLSFVVAGMVASMSASAQSVSTCVTGNSLIIGTYGFVLNAGALFSGVTTNPPGTTGAATFQALAANPPGTSGSVTYSNTELGRLFGGLAGTSVGAVSGQLYFDGNGSIFASSTVGGPPSTLVGTYTVNSDCTLTVSLNDAFSTTARPPSISFTGLLANGGAEIDLVPSSQMTPSSTGTSVPPTSFVQLVRVNLPTGCSASTLTGAYALVGSGLTSANATIAFLARLRFDGNGNIVDDTVLGVTTPLASLQYTGTYTVNADCTGALTLSQKLSATATTGGGKSATTTPFTVTFVVTDPLVQVNSAGAVAFQSAFQLRPSFVFSFANQTQVVSGIGKAQ
jgi:hypothetical protein